MCGIFGFIGTKKQPIKYTTLLNLGCENDSRGGDGCGLFIDGQVEYSDIKKVKKFRDFFNHSKLLNSTREAQIIVGHDRKASVGGVSQDKLHPICFTDKNNKINFIMIHNGTLYNYEELAKKYLHLSDTDIKKYSDSQILAQIIYHNGFGVLSEYIGSATILVVDYRNKHKEPKVYAYHGKSREYASSKVETEERPFYYYRDNDGIWFSSMTNYFDILAYAQNKYVYNLPTNKVIWLNWDAKDKLGAIKEIDRSKCYQKEKYTTVKYIDNRPTGYGYINNQNENFYDWYNEYNFGWYSADENLNVNTQQNSEIGEIVRKDFKYYDKKTNQPLHGTIYINKKFQYSYVKSQIPNYYATLHFLYGMLMFDKNIMEDFTFLNDPTLNTDEIPECVEILYSGTNIPIKIDDNWCFFDFDDPKPQILKHKVVYIPSFNTTCVDLFEYTIDDGKIIKCTISDKKFDWFLSEYNRLLQKSDTQILSRKEIVL